MRPGLESGVGAACAAALLVMLSALCACEAVPSLTFESDEGGSDGAGTPGQCPDKVPQNATCCGNGNTVPCYGNYCSGANCTTGCAMCAPPQICCSKNPMMVVCQAKCQ
jgi:hypothetical protein